MKIEKEQLQLKEFHLQAASHGGTMSIVGVQEHYQLNPLQFSYLQVFKTGTSIEGLVLFFLGQGWLVNFRELFTLLQFLVQKKILLNPSIVTYFTAHSPLAPEKFTSNFQKKAFALHNLNAQQLPFFRSLNPELAQHFLKNADILEVPAQTRLVQAGQRDRDLFIILEGQAAIYRVLSEKQRSLIAILDSGAIFGERGFLLNQPRSADVITTQNSRVLRVRHLPEYDALIKSTAAQGLQQRFWILQALAASSIFKDLPSDSLDSLIFSGRICQAPAQHVLFQEGQPGNTCYLIIQGNVVVSQQGRNINVLSQGGCFGEISLLMSGGKRTATVQCQQDSLFLEITQNNFYQVLGQNIFLAKEIETLAAQRITNDAARR